MLNEKEFDALIRAHLAPFSTKSDFARLYADEVASLASQNMISTWLPGGTYGREWRITVTGLFFLKRSSSKYFEDYEENVEQDKRAGWR